MLDAFRERRAHMHAVAKRKAGPVIPPGARTEVAYYRGQRIERVIDSGRELAAYDRLPIGVLEIDSHTLTIGYASGPAVTFLREFGFLPTEIPQPGKVDNEKDPRAGLIGRRIQEFDQAGIDLAALVLKGTAAPQRITIPFAGQDCRVSIGVAPSESGAPNEGEADTLVFMFEPQLRIPRRTTYSVLDRIPSGVILLKLGTTEILFANSRARELLDELEVWDAEQGIEGLRLGALHDDPAALEAAARSLGSKEVSDRVERFTAHHGDRWVGLGLHPFLDETGKPIAGIILFSEITARIASTQQFRESLQAVMGALTDEVHALVRGATSMAVQTREAHGTANAASAKVEATVAAGDAIVADADRLSNSIDSVKLRAIDSFSAAGRLSGEADDAQNEVNELSAAAEDIGQSIALIEEIALKTELLALNATVEAARAGDAGRGFAVVAGEVRFLSKDTEGATKAISQQIKRIQEAIERTADSFDRMRATLKRVEGNTGENRDSSVQDSEAMGEIRERIYEISRQINDTRKAIATVDDRIAKTDSLAGSVDLAAHQVEDRLARLTEGVDHFMREVEEG